MLRRASFASYNARTRDELGRRLAHFWAGRPRFGRGTERVCAAMHVRRGDKLTEMGRGYARSTAVQIWEG
jgi:hypothetical protein